MKETFICDDCGEKCQENDIWSCYDCGKILCGDCIRHKENSSVVTCYECADKKEELNVLPLL